MWSTAIVKNCVAIEMYIESIILKETKLNPITTNNLSAKVSDTVFSSLRRDEAHAVAWPSLGHLAHLGPLVFIRIVIHHVRQTVPGLIITSCNDASTGVIKDMEVSSPETIKWPLGRDTPLKPPLAEGKLATVCQEVPPSFFRISVEAASTCLPGPCLREPPATI